MAKREIERKPSPSESPRAEVKVESGVAPLFAINKVVYGAGQTALSEIFVPVSQGERDELLSAKKPAVRELTDAEVALHEKLSGPKKAAPAEAPVVDPTPSDDSEVIG